MPKKSANPDQKKVKDVYSKDGSDKLLPRLSQAVFKRPRAAALVWVILTVFGLASYTTFMTRAGFPSIDIPFSVASGAYLVNDPEKVDTQVTKPISDIALKDKRVKSVQSHAQANFYDVIIQYEEGTNADAAGADIAKQIEKAGLPSQAVVNVETPKIGFTERGDDAVISFYAKNGAVSTEELAAQSASLVDFIKKQNIPEVADVSLVDPFAKGIDPLTGRQGETQTKFDRYGERADGKNAFYDSVSVGITQKKDTDVIKLDKHMNEAVDKYNRENGDSPYKAVVSASFAPSIEEQIDELQKALLEGLLAVLVVGSLVIALRAALITILSMLTVLAITLGVLFLVGYTLNTITLFALILCLGLIVDDTIIMVEALEAQRRKQKDATATVRVATRKVSRAMLAATLTAALSFAPLLFVGGILGGFIRAIPVTVITSLLVSLSVALFFIPFFARLLLLRPSEFKKERKLRGIAKIEARVAAFVCKPMLWARHSRKKEISVGLAAVFIGLAFVMAGGALFSKVTFNIFPPSKDTNGLQVSMAFTPDTDIKQAEAVADRADKVIGDTLGENFDSASYYSIANDQSATLTVYLIPYNERDVKSPQLKDELNDKFKDFEGAQVEVNLADVGPPAGGFNVQIESDNRQAAQKLAKDINEFLQTTTLKRPNGTVIKVDSTAISDPGTYYRTDGKQYTQVSATFVDTDTSTIVDVTKKAVQKEFTPEKVASYGLDKNALNFDIGQEEENQDSFKSLAMAFPVLLLVIYLLLATQFRSLLQPLLIFMAIPFSLFGITLGLYLTDNAFSFFAMLGFFALIGLSIKNTILLTDFANQLRHNGTQAIDAAVGALEERFRPLIATSLTAVVSLIPLALASPFWQGLTVVLIFGLLSSTFLVITVFPYYYLGGEYLRLRVSRKAGLTWLVGTAVLTVVLAAAGLGGGALPLAALLMLAGQISYGKARKRS